MSISFPTTQTKNCPSTKAYHTTRFEGFHPLDANFLYCPNQLFDLCLSHHSRGAVRLVGYMLRQTLGWLDEHGEPVNEHVSVSYRRLISHAGISRGAIRAAIDEAIEARFIRCVRDGHAKSRGRASQTTRYALRWDETGDYTKDPKRFNGFYGGEGHRSPIPNAFFDQIVVAEPLSVVKVVGVVLRHTVGYQSRFGGRRQQAPLSYSYIQGYTNISDRSTLSQAIYKAMDVGYIDRVRQGRFDPVARSLDCAAVYAVRWRSQATANQLQAEIAPNKAIDWSDRYKNPTSIGTKTRPENRSKNPTQEKTITNNISKQHLREDVVCHDHGDKSYQLLREQGFDRRAAEQLTSVRSTAQIEKQIEWLEQRRPQQNRLGLLRRAIEENWSAPVSSQLLKNATTLATEFAHQFYAGLAANHDDPAGAAGPTDMLAAEQYVDRLRAIASNADHASAWGRAFGTFVREHRPSWMSITSLPRSIRYFGDEFFKRFKARQDQERHTQVESRRTAHRAQFQSQWCQYVTAVERRIRTSRLRDYARFTSWRKAKRLDLANARFLLQKDRMLARFDSREGTIGQFCEFFKDDVLGFWEWDAQFNRTNTFQP